MPSHRWDPGIDGGVVLGKRNHKGRSKGISFRGSSSNLRCCGSGTGNWFKRIFWKSRTSAKWISILAIIPVNSHDYSGTGGLEWLTGKWVLWLVSLNQPQKTELIIETDLKENHILAGADVRRLIWHVEEFGVFSRIASLLLVFLKNTNSRSQGSLEGICGVERRESSRFFILVLLANDRVGDIGLSMFMFSGYWSYKEDTFIFLVYMLPFYIDWGKEMDVFFRVFVGIWESLDWRVRNIYVRNGIFSPMLIAQREEFSFLLQVVIFSAFYVKKENGKYGSLRPQTKNNRRFMEIGYLYTR
ncbi:PREDICTED: uncharacterized protein LOC106338904 [Brassica oleracea var. oleracea]|uniref:uncharacterized protein LOC106338904 n=1 Tax=Brassica oleracea var. oleracea TaxID=109376 RepID=UPI0006A6E6C8|nr:PREDICTED: uncharacterized protein LOC106338904 [Brassica oleracea var. oleracea]